MASTPLFPQVPADLLHDFYIKPLPHLFLSIFGQPLALLLTWSALRKYNHGLMWSGLLFRAHLHWPPFECFWAFDANHLLSWFSAKSLKNYFLRVTDVENKLKVTRRARGRGGINWKTGIDIYTLLLLLLLSRCSRVQLCATPQTAAHQAPPSLGFYRQELWSGLPFPSPMHESEKWKWGPQSCLTLSDPMDCSLPGSSIHGIFQARVLEWGAIAFSKIHTTMYKIENKNLLYSTRNSNTL